MNLKDFIQDLCCTDLKAEIRDLQYKLLQMDWSFSHPKAQIIRKVDSGTISRLLNKLGASSPHISDSEFGLITKEDLELFLGKDLINAKKYIPETYDCDDFSFELSGAVTRWMPSIPFGIVWVHWYEDRTYKGHALNIFIDNELGVWFVEPQTDSLFKKPGNWIIDLVVL